MNGKKKIGEQTIVAQMTEETLMNRVNKNYNQVKEMYLGKRTDSEIRGGSLTGVITGCLYDMWRQIDLKDGQYFHLVIGESPDNYIISLEGKWKESIQPALNSTVLYRNGFDLESCNKCVHGLQYVLDHLEDFLEDWKESA